MDYTVLEYYCQVGKREFGLYAVIASPGWAILVDNQAMNDFPSVGIAVPPFSLLSIHLKFSTRAFHLRLAVCCPLLSSGRNDYFVRFYNKWLAAR
jgi:hypothetical protein